MESKWISVKERLPLVPQFVIAHKKTKPNVLGLYFDSSKDFRYASSIHTKDVTHWMPLTDLPSPPTEQQDNGNN